MSKFGDAAKVVLRIKSTSVKCLFLKGRKISNCCSILYIKTMEKVQQVKRKARKQKQNKTKQK